MTYYVLITGANKGIGYGFVQKYLSRPSTTVIATVRNPDAADSKSLYDIPKADGSKILVVKVDAASDVDATKLTKTLLEENIKHLDVVIANAAIFTSDAFTKVVDSKPEHLLEHFNVNTIGPVRLFKATAQFLEAASRPKFVVISSMAGSIAASEFVPYPLTSYGSSKAALNYVLRRVHVENPELIAITFHPGVVASASGDDVRDLLGITEMPTSVKDSVEGMVSQIDRATREETSGKFLGFEGSEPLPW